MPSAMYLAVDRVSQLRVLASMYTAVVSVISNLGSRQFRSINHSSCIALRVGGLTQPSERRLPQPSSWLPAFAFAVAMIKQPVITCGLMLAGVVPLNGGRAIWAYRLVIASRSRFIVLVCGLVV